MVKAFYTPAARRLPATLEGIKRSVRDIQRPTGTEREQSLRKLQEALATLEEQQATLATQQTELAAQQALLSSTVTTLWQTVTRLNDTVTRLDGVVQSIPVAVARQAVGNAFTPTSSWATVASFSAGRPSGKTLASVMALGAVALNWSVNGSGAWPVVQIRVLVDGVAGPAIPLGQGVSAAATSVSGRMSGTAVHSREVSHASAAVAVALQVRISGWIGDGAQGTATWSGGSPQVAANIVFSP